MLLTGRVKQGAKEPLPGLCALPMCGRPFLVPGKFFRSDTSSPSGIAPAKTNGQLVAHESSSVLAPEMLFLGQPPPNFSLKMTESPQTRYLGLIQLKRAHFFLSFSLQQGHLDDKHWHRAGSPSRRLGLSSNTLVSAQKFWGSLLSDSQGHPITFQ